jgi:hypothetical protein
MQLDLDLRYRITACAAQELAAVGNKQAATPQYWVDAHLWQLVVSPGWPEAYSYAVSTNVVRPGWDPGVITDAMILAAVQPLVQSGV